jgi:hypothetical protein
VNTEAPKLGEWLRRKDNGAWARVDHIAETGKYNPPTMVPMHEGDVILKYCGTRNGVTSVCSGGAYFWTKWERVDPAHVAKVSLESWQRS